MYSLKTVNVHGLRSNQRNAGSQVLLYVFALLVSLASMTPCLGQASKSAKKTEVKSVSTDGEFDSGHIYTRIFTPEEMEYLKNTTTLFLLRKQDMDKKAEFEEAIHRAWTFSDIKVISYDEIATSDSRFKKSDDIKY